MKKNYILSGLILMASVGFSQVTPENYPKSDVEIIQAPYDISKEYNPEIAKYSKRFENKVLGDTIFYEPFTNGLPTGWTISNANSGVNNFAWEWTTTYRAGSIVPGIPRIGSTTGATGFMSLPSDFYNSPNGDTEMDTWFTSPAIPIDPPRKSVLVSYQQYLAYCCRGNNELVIEVSKDSVNWGAIDAKDGLPTNAANSFGTQTTRPSAINVINISDSAANEDTIYIRFRSTGNTQYWWMIDDIALIEGPQNDINMTNPYLEFNALRYQINPFYRLIPYDLFTPLPFSANVNNNGWDTAYSATLNVDVTHINGFNGAAGTGNVYSEVQEVVGNNGDGNLAPFPGSEQVVVGLGAGSAPFVPLVNGSFAVDFYVSADSAEQINDDGDAYQRQFFFTTDTIYARDDNGFGGGTGPASYLTGAGTPVLGGNDFDAFGTIYIVESRTQNTSVIPTSITYYVTADPNNVGVGIIPTVWNFYEDSSTIATAWDRIGGIAIDGPSYTVTANDTNTFLTLSLDTAGFGGLDSGQYVVGWETFSGGKPNGTSYFEVANDNTTALRQTNSTLFYHEHSGAAGFVPVNPVIRLNLGTSPLQTSVNSIENTQNSVFEIVPNPNDGQFNLNIAVENQSNYNLSIRNMLGQIVYTDILNVNGAMTKRLDLSSLDKGVYFVILENSTERLQKKVILK